MNPGVTTRLLSLLRDARHEWGRFVFVPFVTPAYVVLLLAFGGDVRPEHWVLSLAALVIGFAGVRGASFLRDAYPWLLTITTYDAVRYLRAAWVHADSVMGCGVRAAELQLFAVTPGVTASDWLVARHRIGWDLFFSVPYGVFAYLALGYATYLYFRDRARMRHFLWSFAAANFLSFGLWLTVPAAPPWYLRSHGCGIDMMAAPSEAAALARVDALLGMDYFHAFYSRAASVFGAIPSMHAAYPMLGLLTAWKHITWRTRPLHLAYAAWMACAALYLDHHWVLDVLAGWAVAGVAVVVTAQWLGASRPADGRSTPGEPAVSVTLPPGGPMHPGRLPSWLTRRRISQVLAIALVVLAGVALERQLPEAAQGVLHAHPIALASVGLFFVWNHAATLAWRALLRATSDSVPPLAELTRLRIEAQAVNQVVPSAGVAGEALRVVRAARGHDVGPAALATALDNVAGTLAGLGFALPVGIIALAGHAKSGTLGIESALLALGLSLALLGGATAAFFHLVPDWLPRLSPTGRLHKLLAPFTDRNRVVRRAFVRALGLRFIERIVAIGEIYVLFRAVGAPISLAGSALVSALLVIVSFAVFFVPGQLGAAEAATTAVSSFLGIPPAVGLSAALLRRARQLFVCVLGLASFLGRRRATTGPPPHGIVEAR